MMTKNRSVIFGIIHDHNGQPISEARVYFIDGPVPFPDIAFLTDSNGKFSLTTPAEGTYIIGCSADGFKSANLTVNVIDGKNVEVEIKLFK
jgi:hypothetical protein